MLQIKEFKVCETSDYGYWKKKCEALAGQKKLRHQIRGDKDIGDCVYYLDGTDIPTQEYYAEWDGVKGEILRLSL